jgi:RsmE family RNA methyltransferase
VNIILFEPGEAELSFLPPGDPRAGHLLSVLRARAGDSFTAGILNGMKGDMHILRAGEDGVGFRFVPRGPSEPLLPLDLIIGLPRPLVTGRLLKDLAAMGLRSLHFVRTGLCEKSYMSGSLWKNHEYRRHLLEGLQQSGQTLLPDVRLHENFDACLSLFALGPRAAGHGDDVLRCVMHPGGAGLGEVPPRRSAVLAIGPERGWTPAELEKFTAEGFRVCGMGKRILRTEAAALAAGAILLSRMGLM